MRSILNCCSFNIFPLSKKEDTHRILGVDPGTNILGFAIIEIEKKQMKLLELGVVHLSKLGDQPQKLKKIFERIHTIIDVYRPDHMAIEAPFFGKNPQSMLKLGRAQGVAMAGAITKGVELTEYSPKKIKQSVTGNGNASKEQVAAMLCQILSFKLDGHYLDATDALAVAVCHHYQAGSPFGGSKKYAGWDGFIKDNPDKVK
ncbi:MAG: crossover junction endodeoxyribonuclease RuvC [Saprospiraceae bacterium]